MIAWPGFPVVRYYILSVRLSNFGDDGQKVQYTESIHKWMFMFHSGQRSAGTKVGALQLNLFAQDSAYSHFTSFDEFLCHAREVLAPLIAAILENIIPICTHH